MRGYAYAGGGRRVTRVEVSLDEGETWTLASMYAYAIQNQRPFNSAKKRLS